MRSITLNVYLADVFPSTDRAQRWIDSDTDTEIEIDVEYSVDEADPSTGIMRAHAVDICVVKSYDDVLLPIADAQRWLDCGCRDAERLLERLHEEANDDNYGYDADYARERRDANRLDR